MTQIIVTAESVVNGTEPKLIHGEVQSTPSMAIELRRSALLPNPAVATYNPIKDAAPGISNTTAWTDEQVRERLEVIKKEDLSWDTTTGSSRKWWLAFEEENKHRLKLVLRLAEELRIRKATITQFFLAYVYSNTDNIQANLHYFDYWQLKNATRSQEKDNTPPAPPDSPPPTTT